MPHFFLDAKLEAGKEVEITGADARHILKVLRLKKGDWIVLSDGKGNSFRAIITHSTGSALTANIKELIQRIEQPSPTLAISLIKGDRFEWMIEKVVEIGCQRIIPFISERTVPFFKEASAKKKLERWNKIALAAAKQSGLPFKPIVESPIKFEELFQLFEKTTRFFLFYEGEKEQSIRDVFSTIHDSRFTIHDVLIVGPEGGFTKDEVELAKSNGATSVSLGQQILRVETAAIVAVAGWMMFNTGKH